LSTINGLFTIGKDPANAGRNLAGKLDDLAIFNTVLNSTERAQLLSASVGTVQASSHGDFDPVGTGSGHLVAYWNFDNPVGTTTVAGNGGTSVSLLIGNAPIPVTFNVGGGPTISGTGQTFNSVVLDGSQSYLRASDSSSLEFDKTQGSIT